MLLNYYLNAIELVRDRPALRRVELKNSYLGKTGGIATSQDEIFELANDLKEAKRRYQQMH